MTRLPLLHGGTCCYAEDESEVSFRYEGQPMSEQEEIVQFLKLEYDNKKLPHAANQLRVSHYGPFATLDTGTWDGQITVVGVRFHNGEYEIRDYENRSRHYKTFDQLKGGLAAFLESVKEEQLDRVVKEAATNGRGRR